MIEEMPEITKGEAEDIDGYPEGRSVVIPTMGLAPDVHGTQSRAYEQDDEGGYSTPARVTFSRYILDLDDRVLSADSDFEKITGYTEDDILDGWLTQGDLIPKTQRQEYFSRVADQLEEGDVVYMEHEIVRKDGHHVYVLCYAKRHYDSASKTIRTEVTIVDSSTIKVFNKDAREVK
jgi:PAS domain S-box-containing protein